MAHRFIVGESPAAAARTLRGLWDEGIASSVDLLGEATVTAPEADRYAERCSEALRALAEATRQWPARPALEADGHGELPRVNLSVKVSALTRGPGRLCVALGIGRELSGTDLCTSERLWLERGGPRPRIQVSTRIGLSRDQHRRLRFLEHGSRFVSVPP
jgi:RHH-type proline utilization regulon transcriptional repressor/proline dehydrogenase/delta 1-pyrroline-5-carboxylate dehydrogenase